MRPGDDGLPSRAGSSGLWPPIPVDQAAAHHHRRRPAGRTGRARPGCRRHRRRPPRPAARPRARRATVRPRSFSIAATAAPRSGWRGTTTSSGCRARPGDDVGDDLAPRPRGCWRRPAPAARPTAARSAASARASTGSGSARRLRFSAAHQLARRAPASQSPVRASWTGPASNRPNRARAAPGSAAPAAGCSSRTAAPTSGPAARPRAFAANRQVGPDLALDEDGEVGPPVVDEPPRAPAACRPARTGGSRPAGSRRAISCGRGDRARGDEHRHIAPLTDEALDQRQVRQGLADAGAVQPDQRPDRPLEAGDPAPLVEPVAVLLAALQPPLEQGRRERLDQPGRRRIEPGARAAVSSQTAPRPAASPRSAVPTSPPRSPRPRPRPPSAEPPAAPPRPPRRGRTAGRTSPCPRCRAASAAWPRCPSGTPARRRAWRSAASPARSCSLGPRGPSGVITRQPPPFTQVIASRNACGRRPAPWPRRPAWPRSRGWPGKPARGQRPGDELPVLRGRDQRAGALAPPLRRGGEAERDAAVPEQRHRRRCRRPAPARRSRGSRAASARSSASAAYSRRASQPGRTGRARSAAGPSRAPPSPGPGSAPAGRRGRACAPGAAWPPVSTTRPRSMT